MSSENVSIIGNESSINTTTSDQFKSISLLITKLGKEKPSNYPKRLNISPPLIHACTSYTSEVHA